MVDLSIATLSRAGWFPRKKRLVACVARRNWLLLDAQAWNHRFAAPCCTKPGNLSSGVTHEPYMEPWANCQQKSPHLVHVLLPHVRGPSLHAVNTLQDMQRVLDHSLNACRCVVLQLPTTCYVHLISQLDFILFRFAPGPQLPRSAPHHAKHCRCSLARPLSEKGKPGTGFVLRLSPVSGQTLYQQFERSMVDSQRNLFDFWYHKHP